MLGKRKRKTFEEEVALLKKQSEKDLANEIATMQRRLAAAQEAWNWMKYGGGKEKEAGKDVEEDEDDEEDAMFD